MKIATLKGRICFIKWASDGMADMHDSKSCAARHGSSTLPSPTKQNSVRDTHDSPQQSPAQK